ncbi:hypothetical protein A2U01_0084453, partial [Trifolium medium]|nr:hypothetical protein [Trifolium medium]
MNPRELKSASQKEGGETLLFLLGELQGSQQPPLWTLGSWRHPQQQ